MSSLPNNTDVLVIEASRMAVQPQSPLSPRCSSQPSAASRQLSFTSFLPTGRIVLQESGRHEHLITFGNP